MAAHRDAWRKSVMLARGRGNNKITAPIIGDDDDDWMTDESLQRILGTAYDQLEPTGYFSEDYVDKIRRDLPSSAKKLKNKKK